MKTAAFFPDGVGIRNFILGSFLHRIAERGTVYAFHRIPEDRLDSYRQGLNGALQWHRCPPYQDAVLPCFLRKSLVHAHLCFCDTQAMRYARKLPVKGNLPARAMTYAARSFGYLSASPRNIRGLLTMHDRAIARLPQTAEYVKLFESLSPTVLFCSHQRALEVIPAAVAARSMGIPTATFIFSWDNITSKGRIAAPFDHFLVWSQLMKKELLEYYPEVEEENVHIVGTPQFDPHADDNLIWSREEFCKRVGADPNRPIICYSGGEPGTTPEDPAHLRTLLELVRSGRITHNPQVLLRPAPVTRADERERYGPVCRDFPELIYCQPQWQQTVSGDWASVIPKQEDLQFLSNLIYHSHLNVNLASTMTLDFAVRDKPVVNVGFDCSDPPYFGVPVTEYYYKFEHYRPVIELGAARLARSPAELAEHINDYLKNPKLDQEKRRALVELELDGSVGNAGDRVAETLQRISL